MILGLDWGQRKIGMAIVYEDVPIASAIGTVENNVMVFDALQGVIDEYAVTMIVIGRSTHAEQNDNVAAISAFGTRCHEVFGVPVVYAQEMFSTREAHHNLKSAGKKNLGAIDDAEAARIILQHYIDAENWKM